VSSVNPPPDASNLGVFPASPVRVASITLGKWVEVPVVAGFVVWLATDKAGSKPSWSSTSAHLGIATAAVLVVVLVLMAIPAGRSRVIASPTGLIVVNPFRRYEIATSQLRRVSWTRYRLAPGSVMKFPVVTFSVQTSPNARLQSVRAVSSLGGPRQDELIKYLDRLCSEHSIPCALATE
jgi:hypothetical protein